jgi:hypothetical protein
MVFDFRDNGREVAVDGDEEDISRIWSDSNTRWIEWNTQTVRQTADGGGPEYAFGSKNGGPRVLLSPANSAFIQIIHPSTIITSLTPPLYIPMSHHSALQQA